ncbi:MAG: hypothetical protein NT038_03590 [Euryarchaeota archaeon]|nr:hypothetical protein [Euryarchaeota archaeon]
MVDDEIKKSVCDFISSKKFFTTRRISRDLNIPVHTVSTILRVLNAEGRIEVYNRRTWKTIKEPLI